MKHLVLTGIAALGLASCATNSAQTFTFDNTRDIGASYDNTWEAVISYFATNNIPIATLEKDSGLIVAKNERYAVNLMNEVASCEQGILETPQNGQVSVNVFVRPKSDDVTSVQVNTQYTMTVRGYGDVIVSNSCNSNGSLESALLDRIEQDAI